MEFLFFAALFLFFLARASKKKNQQAGDKWAGFEENKRRLAPEQEKYDQMLFGLPELVGDRSFSQDVVGEQAYKETLDLYGEYIEKYHPGEEEIWVLVELEPDNEYDENAVRIEAGQATVGYIPRVEAEEFGRELRALGGKARANARFYWDREGGRSSLTIDAIRPLKKK